MLLLGSIAWGAKPRSHAGVAPRKAVHAVATRWATGPKALTPRHAAAAQSSAKASLAPSPLAAPPVAAGQAGMRIFKDPETGEIGPATPEAAATIASDREPPFDNQSMRMVRLPNGTLELINDGQVEDAVVMQLDAQGHRIIRCVNDPKAAAKQVPVASPAPQREDR